MKKCPKTTSGKHYWHLGNEILKKVDLIDIGIKDGCGQPVLVEEIVKKETKRKISKANKGRTVSKAIILKRTPEVIQYEKDLKIGQRMKRVYLKWHKKKLKEARLDSARQERVKMAKALMGKRGLKGRLGEFDRGYYEAISDLNQKIDNYLSAPFRLDGKVSNMSSKNKVVSGKYVKKARYR